MTYVQPKFLFSSLEVVGSTNFLDADEYVSMNVDLELIRNEPDIRLNLLDAITRTFHELGVECLGSGDNKHPLAIEIRDEDIDKVVDLNIELEAGEILEEVYCRNYLIEFYGFAPRRFELTGMLWIDGFEVVG